MSLKGGLFTCLTLFQIRAFQGTGSGNTHFRIAVLKPYCVQFWKKCSDL